MPAANDLESGVYGHAVQYTDNLEIILTLDNPDYYWALYVTGSDMWLCVPIRRREAVASPSRGRRRSPPQLGFS